MDQDDNRFASRSEVNDAEQNAAIAASLLQLGLGKRSGLSSLTGAASMRERMAELDRYVGAAVANNNSRSGASNDEWPSSNDGIKMQNEEESLQSSSSKQSNVLVVDVGEKQTYPRVPSPDSKATDLSTNNEAGESPKQLQPQDIVEPWQLCPPASRSPHKCALCSACYVSKAGLRRHIENKHPGMTEGTMASSSNTAQSSWHCEHCDRTFYQQSMLVRHYAEAHPSDGQSNSCNNSLSTVGNSTQQQALMFPNLLTPTDAITAAAAAIRLGMSLPFQTGPASQLTAASLMNQLPSILSSTTPVSTANEEQQVIPLRKEGEGELVKMHSGNVGGGGGDNGDGSVECVFCAKEFPNTNPALIFHQVTVHKISIDSFKVLSPSNCINCPDCGLLLDAKNPGFPDNHACPGPKMTFPTSLSLSARNNSKTNNNSTNNSKENSPSNNVCLSSPFQLSLFTCPLCSDLFRLKPALAEHVTSFHRTDFALFDINGRFFTQYCAFSASTNIPASSPEPENLSRSSNEAPNNSSAAHNKRKEPSISGETVTAGEPVVLPPNKRRPLATRASAADKWRNVDGFDCGHCPATFLTSQSRAQHLRWRHPEAYALSKASSDVSSPNKPQPIPGSESTSTDQATAPGSTEQLPSPAIKKTNETYNCPVCNSSYISPRSRAQHIRWSHPEYPLAGINLAPLPAGTDASEGGAPPGVPCDDSLLANLSSGFKGSCEVCGIELVNAQGRAQHLKGKHPEAWAMLRNSKNALLNNPVTVNHSALDNKASSGQNEAIVQSATLDNIGEAGSSENGNFPCIFCEKVFTSKRGRGRHYYWTHQQRLKDYTGPFSTNAYCKQLQASHCEDAAASTDNGRWFSCPRCPKRCRRRVGLSIHIAQAHRRRSKAEGEGKHDGFDTAESIAMKEAQQYAEESPTAKIAAKKDSLPAATARCLQCESCFHHQPDVIRHLLEDHDISDPTDAHWVWVVTHTDIDPADEDEDILPERPVPLDRIPADLHCIDCQKVFPNELLFRGHMMLEHQVQMGESSSNHNNETLQCESVLPVAADKTPRCSDCNKEFTSQRALHIHEHHTQHGPRRRDATSMLPSSTLDCTQCYDRPQFSSTTELQLHTERKHKTFRCSNCSLLVEGRDEFNAHKCPNEPQVAQTGALPNTTGLGPTTCEVCLRNFSSSRALHIHQKMACFRSGSAKPAFSNPQPQPRKRSSDAQPMWPPSDMSAVEVFRCDMCEESFSRPQGLACHKRSRHNYVSMSPRCIASRKKRAVAARGDEVGDTVSLHEPMNEAYCCPMCPGTFSNRFALAKHLNDVVNSKCANQRWKLRRGYQNHVWAAVRQGLLVGKNVNRRELLGSWIERFCQRASNKEQEQQPITDENSKTGIRRRPKKKAFSPKRSPGRRRSPPLVLSKRRLTRRQEARLHKKQIDRLSGSDSSTDDRGVGTENLATNLSSANNTNAAAAHVQAQVQTTSSGDATRCTMCGRHFSTSVELMIHYCRDNCAAKNKKQSSNEKMDTEPQYSNNESPSDLSTLVDTSASRKPRIKMPTTFESEDIGRPTAAFL